LRKHTKDTRRLRELILREGSPIGTRVDTIGECGLDYNRNFSPRDAQRKRFEDRLALSMEMESW